ncbi:MAG: methyltransferase domain-containing protein [Mariprofundaceae bacterium]|nr:methyltransferase domain-containing protein [Mariprofundaceae bacterium]
MNNTLLPHQEKQDTNFDELASHFQKRIYGSRKGKIRLAVLQRDLLEQIPELKKGGLEILDIGGGLAQMGLYCASFDNHVTINDLSKSMLDMGKLEAKKQGLMDDMTWHHGAYQTLEHKKYDLVLCHAVLEWLAEPTLLLETLAKFCKDDGRISLMFYNIDALILHNLIRGNFNKIKNQDFSGMKGGLTPLNPVSPAWVEETLKNNGLDVFYKSGIRVFSDYVGIKHGGNEKDVDVLDMELSFSQQQPYINIGRYVHFICKKNQTAHSVVCQ